MNNNQLQNQTSSALFLAIGLVVAVLIFVFGQLVLASNEAQLLRAEQKLLATKNCYELARGTRTTSGQSNSEQWQLSQVDINYEVVDKCLSQSSQ